MTRNKTVAHVLVWILFFAVLTATVSAQTRPDALVLYRQGQYERAVDVTLAELSDNPRNLDSYTVLGWSLLALGRYEDAREYGEQGLEISRFDHRLVHIVGEANYQLGNNLARCSTCKTTLRWHRAVRL